VQMKSVLASASLGIGVWLSAVIGMALKLALPGRFDRLAILLCFAARDRVASGAR
jgi:hemolysin III